MRLISQLKKVEIKEETKSLKIPERDRDMILMRQTLEVAQARSKKKQDVRKGGAVSLVLSSVWT